MARFASLRNNGDSIIAAAAGFCFVVWLTRHGGIGISPDSVTYISVAENLRYHGVLKDFGQLPMTDFPALYPIFLSAVMLVTGIKPLLFGPWLNALLFAGVIYTSGSMMNRFSFSNRWCKWMVLSIIVLSPALQEVYCMLWSETLFILLLLLLMSALHRYYNTPGIRQVVIMALLAGLLCITRYAGIAFIATVAFLLLVNPGMPWKKRGIHFGMFLLISIVLPLVNLLHNSQASGTLTGYREKALRSLMGNITDMGTVLIGWLPFADRLPSAAPAIALLLIGAAGMCWLWRLYRRRQFDSLENIATGFFLSYTIFMIASASISRFETLSSRLLSPAFIPMLWTVSAGCMQAIRAAAPRWKKTGIALGIAIFGCFQYGQWQNNKDTWVQLTHAGIPGYGEDEWKLSPTIQYIQQHKAQFTFPIGVYSNANDAIWFFTGLRAEMLPHKEFPGDVQQFLVEKHCYVVMFNDGDNPDLVGLDFILNVKKMHVLAQFADGIIYQSN